MKDNFLIYLAMFCLAMIALLSGSLLVLQAQINPLPRVLPPANLAELCEAYAPVEPLTGPECLNPVFWDVDGFIHINATVRYMDEGSVLRVGRVAGYVWQRDEGRYYYLIERFDVAAMYESVAPELVDE